jgi:poly-gamma-glutamate capsule biosynthesis protein CapA/YwtB (metallophosphatase superfamily)
MQRLSSPEPLSETNMRLPALSLLLCALFSAGCGSLNSPLSVQAEESTAKTAKPSPTPIADHEVISIAAVGDIMLASPFPDDTRMPPKDGDGMLDAVKPILSAADIAFGNMEAPIIDSGISPKCKPKVPANTLPTATPNPSATPKPVTCYAFRMPTRYTKYLKDAGFDVMSIANNHALDFGTAGQASTRKSLDANGIKHAGGDRMKFSTAYIDIKGKKVAFIGFAHNAVSPNVNDLVNARRLVAEADKLADIVVVSFHGGAEGSAYQNVPKQTEVFFGEKRGNLPLFSRTVIDAGADLVLGHGPHVLRGMEIYKDRLIAYSLGNFATYGWFSLRNETSLTMILEAHLAPDGKFIGGKIHSGKQEGRGIPALDPSGDSIKKVRSLSKADFAATAPAIDDHGTISSK